jgi:hypothetical protein
MKKWNLMSGNIYSQLPTHVVISKKKYTNGIIFTYTANRISKFILINTSQEMEFDVFSNLKTHKNDHGIRLEASGTRTYTASHLED